jgi:uracil phosphoribosyltransferase
MALLHVVTHPLVQAKLTKLRNKDTQPKRFRDLVREISILLTAEVTQSLTLVPVPVETPLQMTTGYDLGEKVGLIPVLRAGLGMVDGVHELLPGAEVWHIGLRRNEETLEPIYYYERLPSSPTVDLCLILDPMLATGGSAVATAGLLKKWGAKRIIFMGLIAAPEGVTRLAHAHPDIPIYIAGLDERLNEKGYILPGLGDAGDRQFGT